MMVRVALTAVWLVLLGSGLRLGWLVWPYHVLEIRAPIKVTSDPVKIGDVLTFAMDYCKNASFKDLRAEVQYSFTDGLIYNSPVTAGPLDPGCHVAIEAIDMPRVPPGNYRLHVRYVYQVNPVKTVTVDGVSEPFRVFR